MTLRTLTGAVALLTLAGCAGVMPQARLYSAAERLQPGPWQSLDISGEAPYCTGMPYASQNASARQQALANIARACGGEDKYHVVREIETHVRFHGAGGLVETSCPIGAGRAILFKCAGDKTPPPKGR
jgi:hypothetical protein